VLLGFRVVSGKKACDEAWDVFKRDRHKKPAISSGIPIALFAGGLGVKLTKPSSYEIGDGDDITRATVSRAVSVMLFTSMFTLILAAVLLYGRTLM
jgi:cobalamin biosynthesis protein CobD/CbiB